MPGPVPRPTHGLRGYHYRYSQKAFGICALFAVGSGAAFYFLIQKPRSDRFAHFYATADPYKMLEKICEKNAFDSCPQKLAEARGLK